MNKEGIEKIKKYPYKDGVISIIGASITIIVGLLTLLTCIYESDIIINNKLYIYFVYGCNSTAFFLYSQLSY